MKKIAFLALLAIVSCTQDDSPVDVIGSVSFTVSGSVSRYDNLIPEKLVLSVEDVNGKTIFDSKVIDLTPVQGGYTTPSFQLESGQYKITKYLVISGTEAAYATPRSGAQKATLVDKPLPFEFIIVAGLPRIVNPKIVGISTQDVPLDFGYGDFGYNTPGSTSQEWINIRVKLDATVGSIFYPNVDAIYTVHAFDESNTEVWTQNYNYIGPEANDLRIKNGFTRYVIEAKKWGQTIHQVYTQASLYERRVREGEVPVTQVFQVKADPKRIASTISTWTRVVDGQPVTEPGTKTEYQYTDGRLSVIKTYVWSTQSKTFVDQASSGFIYQGETLQKIATNDASGYTEDNYTYDANGNVSHIQHRSSATVTTEVDLVYLGGGRGVRAVYKSSNGTGFEYEFTRPLGSNIEDRTTRSGQLCSTGKYAYDKNVNPLAHLGYTDYLLRNSSISNRTTEDVNYTGCAFPSLVAESYSYVYDSDGYPLKQETKYKGSEVKMVVEYSYLD